MPEELEKMSQQSDFKDMMEGMMGGMNKDGMNELMECLMGGMNKDGAVEQLTDGRAARLAIRPLGAASS
jgi:hypothetical protein